MNDAISLSQLASRIIRSLVFLSMAVVIAACGNATPTQDPNGPVLVGFDALPKQLATVYLSPTPDVQQVKATQAGKPTLPPIPPTFTPTPTPYLGLFVGATISPIPDTGLRTPTRGPVMITFTPSKGTPVAAFSTPVPANSGNPPPNTSSGTGTCTVQPAPQFVNALKNPAVQARIGCPTGAPFTANLVIQPFQTGFMIWRDTKEIYALSTAALQKGSATDTFWRYPDNWNESLPASDPNLQPPAGLSQPIRGFGYVWRSNPNVRNGLGWALSGEQPVQATWQLFERGWMMTGNGVVFALSPLDGPPPTTGVHFGPLNQ